MGLRLHSSHRAIALVALFGSTFFAERAARAQDAPPPAPATPPPVDAPPPPVVAPPPAPAVDAAAVAPTSPTPSEVGTAPAAKTPEATVSEAPLAGYRNGLFYLRSPDDNFRFYVQGRVYADALAYFGPGVSSLAPGDALKTTATVRRARLDLSGEVLHDWQWAIGAEFGQTGADNPGANTTTGSSSVDPATGTLTTSNKQNPVEASVVRPIPTDAFVNYGPTPWTNIEVGQFYLPFSFENRLSDNYTPFLDRSFVIRNIATNNSTRDIGAQFWGESPDKLIHYAVAIQNGDGQNRLNADNRYDFLGRVVVKPFAPGGGSLKGVQIGVSGRTGSRDPKLVGYDATALTTQGGYSFWKPTYKDQLGRTLHIIPSGEQTAYGADIYAPISIVDLTGEFVYSKSNTREAVDNYQLSPFTERFGSLKGWGYYIEAGVWVLGDRDAIGRATFGRAPHVDLTKPQRPAQQALEVLAKYEQAHLTYDGAGRGGTLDPKTPNGDIDVKALSFGLNYWATKHVRVSLNYSFYTFPDSEPVASSSKTGPSQTSGQRAQAPAQLVPKGVDDDARDSGHVIHEMQARVQMSF